MQGVICSFNSGSEALLSEGVSESSLTSLDFCPRFSVVLSALRAREGVDGAMVAATPRRTMQEPECSFEAAGVVDVRTLDERSALVLDREGAEGTHRRAPASK